MKRLLLSLLLTTKLSADCSLMYEPHLDGGIMVFEEQENSIRIYDGRYKEKLTKNDIWWQWNVSHVKDSQFRKLFTRTKNDAKQTVFNGRHAIIIISSRGDGVAIVDIKSRQLVYSRKVAGSVHSAAVIPGDSIVLADSKGYVKLLSTKTNSITSQCRHSSPHGAVWDKTQEVVWVWGGSQMAAYRIGGSERRPILECNSRRMFRGPSGGHDLQPMLDGSSMMIGSSGPNIFFFESDLEWHGAMFGMLQRFPDGKGIKGVSRNNETGEIIYVRNDKSNGYKFRSNVIRSLDGKTRTVVGTAFYKARFFQPNCFSW